MSNCVLIEHLAECKRFKLVKLKSKRLPSIFSGLTFLYLPNVYIHEPNEFIHVRKLKTNSQNSNSLFCAKEIFSVLIV